jgi:hypothetical protein
VSQPDAELNERPPRSEEEMARIALAAKEAKTTIIAVAGVALGGILFMFLFTMAIIALKFL